MLDFVALWTGRAVLLVGGLVVVAYLAELALDRLLLAWNLKRAFLEFAAREWWPQERRNRDRKAATK